MTASRWPVPFLVILSLLTLPSSALAARQCESDLKDFRDMADKTLADHDIDEQVYDRMQKQIARIEAVCASGDEKQARAMIINGMIMLTLWKDDIYVRSVNKPRQSQVLNSGAATPDAFY
jgi:hypothetical protein